MHFIKYLILVLTFIPHVAFAQTSSCEIKGTWKHADKNAWLDVDLNSQTVKVMSHLDNPKANGLIVIKSLTQASGEKSKWLGQMYDASIDGFVPVKLAFNGCREVNVSNNGTNILTLTRE